MVDWLFQVIKGAIIGTGAILPGISGGVLCVVLGIYKPLMDFLAHPIREIKKFLPFILPILLGFAVGVICLARLVNWLFRTSQTPAIWLFIGLVVGTLPALYREAGSQGRPRSAWIALIAGGLIMAGWMVFLSKSQGRQVEPSFIWWLLCGALWGIGLIVPGMSPSSFFIFFGLYEPMTAAIGSLDFSVLLPMAAGLLAAVVLLARGMKILLEHGFAVVMHAIVGIVIASTIAILPLGNTQGFADIALNTLCFAAGCGVAYGLDVLGAR